jgi:hypothetical protein
MNINWNAIAKYIEKLIKDKIKEKKLVKSGKLLNSIEVKSDGDGGFSVIAEDYFKYLDEEHKISKEVFDSQELADFIENEIAEAIDKSL